MGQVLSKPMVKQVKFNDALTVHEYEQVESANPDWIQVYIDGCRFRDRISRVETVLEGILKLKLSKISTNLSTDKQ